MLHPWTPQSELNGAWIAFLHWEPLQLLAPLASTTFRPNPIIGSISTDQSRFAKEWFRPGVDRDEATAIPAMDLPTGTAELLEAPRARTRIERRSAGSHRQQRHSTVCSGQAGGRSPIHETSRHAAESFRASVPPRGHGA